MVPETRSLVIRPERAGDEDAVHVVNLGAFGGPTEARIVDDLRGTDRCIVGGSLVAELRSIVVGHLLLSEGHLVSDAETIRRIWMVGPVAVMPEHQRRGLGGALMRAAIEFATRENLTRATGGCGMDGGAPQRRS